MIKFTTLSLRNFLSYGAAPTIINLDQPGTTLITGEDLDNTDRGAGANGVGKTVIINALVYALYDKPISNISKDNLVNNINKKNMEVTLDFTKDGVSYRIHRVRKMKAGAQGNWVKWYISDANGTLVEKANDSMGNTNKAIEQVIGLPFDLFVRICAVSANHTPFLDLPVRHPTMANQTAIIEKLFDLLQLTDKADVLKVELKTTEGRLEIVKAKVDALAGEHKRHQIQLTTAAKRVDEWDQKNASALETAQKKLDKVRVIDVDVQRNAFELCAQLHSDIKKEQAREGEIKQNIQRLNKAWRTAKKELAHLDDGECPYCLQEYANTKSKIEELNLTISNSETNTTALELELATVSENIQHLTTQCDTESEKIDVSSVDELYDVAGKIAGYEKQIVDLKKSTNPMVEVFEELDAIKLDGIDQTEINELTELISHQKFLMKLLTKKDSFVRKALLNKNIPFLNNKLAGYLNDLGLPHTVEFSHEMTAEISQFGRPMDFGNLSNGQRARVNIALSFAFRDVLQNIHERVNVCMLDEVLDVGLDAIGVQAAAKMLKTKSREEDISLFIISHRDEIDNAFDRQMKIQMTKGFSYLGEEV